MVIRRYKKGKADGFKVGMIFKSPMPQCDIMMRLQYGLVKPDDIDKAIKLIDKVIEYVNKNKGHKYTKGFIEGFKDGRDFVTPEGLVIMANEEAVNIGENMANKIFNKMVEVLDWSIELDTYTEKKLRGLTPLNKGGEEFKDTIMSLTRLNAILKGTRLEAKEVLPSCPPQ